MLAPMQRTDAIFCYHLLSCAIFFGLLESKDSEGHPFTRRMLASGGVLGHMSSIRRVQGKLGLHGVSGQCSWMGRAGCCVSGLS